MRNIIKFIPLGQGKKAGRYVGQQDIRCYRPPRGYRTTAQLIDVHPFTNQQLTRSEWWIFLTPE